MKLSPCQKFRRCLSGYYPPSTAANHRAFIGWLKRADVEATLEVDGGKWHEAYIAPTATIAIEPDI